MKGTMTKFYITDGKHRFVIAKESQADALNAYAKFWLGKGVELNPSIAIGERGFDSAEANGDIVKTHDVLRRVST